MKSMPVREIAVLFGVYILFACQERESVSSNQELHSLTEVAAIGMLEGSDAQTFGEIGDVEIGKDGSILVLDRQAVSIARFSAGGDPIGSYRAEGEGPGEMLRPQDLEVVGDTVLVLDSSNRRIHMIRLVASGLEYEKSIPLPMPGWSLCEMAGRIYLHYRRDGYLLHEVNRDGDVVRSFAPVLEVPETMEGSSLSYVQLQRMRGPVRCLDGPNVIVAIGGISSHIRSFDIDGEPLWETEVTDYKPSLFRMVSGGFPEWDISDDGSNVAIDVVSWTESAVLLQLDVRYPAGDPHDRKDTTLESRLLSLGDGRELARSDLVPRVSGSVGDLFYGWEDDPFPRVRMYRRP